jgi:hypothetical protein
MTIRFDEDHSGAEVTITIPAAGSVYTRDMTLSAQASALDREGGIKYIEFFLGETLLARDSTEPYEVNYPLKQTTTGEYRLRAKATDYAGNEAEDVVMIVVE